MAMTKLSVTVDADVLAEIKRLKGKRAGALRARVEGAGTIDAIVVATADALRGAVILTDDPRDLRRLAAIRCRSVVIPI